MLLVLLAWSAVSILFRFFLDGELSREPDDWPLATHPDYASLKDSSQLVDGFGGVLFVCTVVLWLSWFRRARRNAAAFEPGRVRYSPAMALAVWFIPICNFFMPKQIANDVWAVTRAEPPEWLHGVRYPPRRGLVNGWWSTWLVGFYFGLFLLPSWHGEATIDRAEGLVSVQIISGFVTLPAIIVAAVFVARLTTLQEKRLRGGS
nr:DUF4328 domain-containing protein [Streptomyces oceani]